MTAIPPAYDATATKTSGPELPTTFKIGSTFTKPLVSAQAVKEYLSVLHAFHRLKQHVLGAPWSKLLKPVPHDQAKWAIFLARAKYRFQLWVERVLKAPSGTERPASGLASSRVPPLDVCT